MTPDERRPAPRTTEPQGTTPPRKRFKIDRLEERIAPKKGGKGTHHCGGSSNTITVSCSGY